MKYWLIGILFTCCWHFSAAQKIEFEGLNEYVISDVRHFTILNAKESRMERKYQAMILNEYAEDLNKIVLYYSKFSKIVSLKVSVSGMDGKVIKRYSLKDCRDMTEDWSAVASESRVKYLDIVQSHYPYILNVEYRVYDKGSMVYPTWAPVGDEKQGIKSSTFIVSDPQNVGFRYRNGNVAEPKKEPEGTGSRYTWEVHDVRPVVSEPFAGKLEDVLPVVYLAPVNFEMGGYKGNMESWENYGKWIYQLCSGRDDLKPEQLAEIKKECDALPSVRDKVRAVYHYVQRNTRYVSVQLGIGGWQPFAASHVHQNKFGDCKALAFYTCALLKAVGVPSFYTLIRAGSHVDEIPEDFPTARFNHVIVTVPVERDTIWLECTSQTSPMGYMGTFTSDRNCLLIGENGGRLMRTRKYGEADNLQKTEVDVRLHASGDADLELKRVFTGLEIENYGFLNLLRQSESDKRKWIQDHADCGNLELAGYTIQPLSGDEVPRTGYDVRGLLRGFASASTGRLFLTPCRFSNIFDIKLTAKERKSPIVVRYPYTQEDSILISMPEGYRVEGRIFPVSLTTPYGSYNMKVSEEGGKLRIKRSFCLKAGTFPKTDYDKFKDFITKVQLADRSRLVLVKN